MGNASTKKKDKVEDHLWQVSRPAMNVGGRPRKIETPKQLLKKALEYFEYIDKHPWQEKSASNSLEDSSEPVKESATKTRKKNSVKQEVKVYRRPYTLYGFCAFCGVRSKWADFKRTHTEEGFLEVIEWIEQIITTEQVEGAMLHKYDSNLVARLNSIADTMKTEITGKDGEEFKFPKLTSTDFEELQKLNDQNG